VNWLPTAGRCLLAARPPCPYHRSHGWLPVPGVAPAAPLPTPARWTWPVRRMCFTARPADEGAKRQQPLPEV